ncbi:MAG TPA: PAS domain S-box protein [Opitutus sp.]|nr:PAS domain S-box protein [Opitutus sp.]
MPSPAPILPPPEAATASSWLPEDWLARNEPAYCRDLAGRLLEVNDALCRRLARSAESLQGADIASFLPPDDAGRYLTLAPELTRAPFQVVRDQCWLTPQGLRWYAWQEISVRDDTGSVVAVRAIGRDITRQRQAEEQYFKLAQAVEQFPLAIAITRPDGCAQYANARFAELTGSTLEEILDGRHNVLRPLHPDDASYQAMVARALEGGEWTGETRTVRPIGDQIWESVRVSALRNPAGEVTSLLCLREDITARKQLEQELRQAQKMESLGTLAGGIAHDFNNLLAIINGYTEFCLDSQVEPATMQASLTEIRRAALRAVGLVRQILTFSRKTEARLTAFDLNQQLGDLVQMMQETFPRTVQFNHRSASGLPPIKADQNQIQQVILNLCVNARDAMPGGGTITVATSYRPGASLRHLPGADAAKNYHCIEVADTGTGMTAEVRQHIFEPFFTTKQGNQGTGLGLAVVYGIVTGHGGCLEVDTAPGEGSAFRTYFPDTESTPAIAPGRTAENMDFPGGTESLIVVDDESALRSLLRSSLSRKGYRVDTASSGLDAIELVSDPAQKIDALLLDLNMPGASGFDVLKTIRAVRPRLKVLVLTGHLTSDALAELHRLGQHDYMPKPYKLAELGRTLRELLDRA